MKHLVGGTFYKIAEVFQRTHPEFARTSPYISAYIAELTDLVESLVMRVDALESTKTVDYVAPAPVVDATPDPMPEVAPAVEVEEKKPPESHRVPARLVGTTVPEFVRDAGLAPPANPFAPKDKRGPGRPPKGK